MADAGFGSSAFLQGCTELGFERLLVGVRCDRKLHDGRRLEQLKQRGQQLTLHDLPKVPLWVSWCDVKRDEGKKRFYEHRGGPHPPQWGCYVAATFAASGAYLARRYRRRWLIESFFQSVKHDSSCPLGIGLKEARLRTKTGIRMWLFLACLAYSFASLARHLSQQNFTLLEAAERILDMLVDVRLLHLMADCERFSQRSPRPLKLVAA